MSLLQIHELKLPVRLGCTEEERAYPQHVLIDIELELDFKACILSDELVDTVDYVRVVEKIETITKTGSFQLLERLCFDLAREMLLAFPKVSVVKVGVRKNVISSAQGFRASLSVARSDLKI